MIAVQKSAPGRTDLSIVGLSKKTGVRGIIIVIRKHRKCESAFVFHIYLLRTPFDLLEVTGCIVCALYLMLRRGL